MMMEVSVTGRRLSDGKDYELNLKMDAADERQVEDRLEREYDWEDAATRNIQVRAADFSH